MTSITLPRYKTEDGLACSFIGKGIPLVFIHGVGLRSEAWYQQIEALKGEYSIFTLDMPGHGESDRFKQPNPSLIDYTEVVAKFIIEEVQEPAVIIGHSMGALLSLSLAQIYPELCLAVVAMNTVYKRSPKAKQAVNQRALNLIQISDADSETCAPISRWFGELPSVKDEYHVELCREWLLSGNSDGYAAAYRVFAIEDGPSTKAIKNLTMPVLFLTGELDLNSNISMTKTLASIAPNAEHFIVENSRHMTPLTHATQVNEVLIEFLQRRLVKTEWDLRPL